MKKGFVKWVLLSMFVIGGGVVMFSAPEAIEIFLPEVSTIQMSKCEYSQTVSGMGIIATTDVTAPKTWLVQIAVSESDINKVEVGQMATLKGAAFPEGVYNATVSYISDTARQQSTGLTFETVVDVVLTIKNPDENLRTGYTAQAMIIIGDSMEILTVPYEVICQDDESEYVYVLENHRAVRKNIITGAELAEGAELVYGLRETDEIITVPEQITGEMLVKKSEDTAQ